jgi:hypothetical protein
MSPNAKILAGLVAVLAMAWLYHGPLGVGADLVARAESEARRVVGETEVPGIEVRLGHDPLSRLATLSGSADAFQREGQGELKGLNDLVAQVEGVSTVQWTDEGDPRRGTPLVLEALIWMIGAYLVGLVLGWLVFSRPKKQSYLD